MSKGRTTGPFKVTHQSQSASAKGKSAPWHADAVARTSSAVTIATGGCAKLRSLRGWPGRRCDHADRDRRESFGRDQFLHELDELRREQRT